MRTHFSIPFKFRYMDWSQIKDEGTGICEGQLSNGFGYTKLQATVRDAPIPLGSVFTITPPPFKVEVFDGKIAQYGKQCPEVGKEKMRSTLEGGFNNMFKGGISFEVKMTTPNVLAGYCYLPGYALEGDLIFDCTWFVRNIRRP